LAQKDVEAKQEKQDRKVLVGKTANGVPRGQEDSVGNRASLVGMDDQESVERKVHVVLKEQLALVVSREIKVWACQEQVGVLVVVACQV